MSNSLSLQHFEDITRNALAPVIPMRPVPSENHKQKRKVSKVKREEEMPLFYTKPIFKSKKYDLL
jgi:hypothetical protein